ncbi:GrpB family protein [Pelomonas sp. APW6]|uniref:GrpB family protein n=1 Tax=Roseateles subflavus TaxID=3053353 RepID=A0ABT7LD67_9BURK|nr:GrpB family protein [Pelomonas sp. APW6]MDL5030798.1 GrpB family protein [Pelomonas sp. APW6]
MKILAAADYQPALLALFDRSAAALRALLPQARVEHVGASSIPGASSKGDLDIAVIVPPEAHAQAVARLGEAGFQIKTDTLRTPALCMLLAPGDWSEGHDLALQVIASGSAFEDFLVFRDALRADPALVAAYDEVKRRHAGAGEDAYRTAKARFIESVLARSGDCL